MSKIEKAKNKSNYKPNAFSKNPRKGGVNINLRGFLATCNIREKDCIKESYNILNKYADILYPKVVLETPENCKQNEDIEDELKSELSGLKAEKESKRFQVVDAGAKNILFIRTTLEDPVELAKTIVEDIYTTKAQQTKFLLRLIPIEITCKAFLKDIEKAVEPLIKKYFSHEAKTFSVFFNHRNHNSVTRDEVIKSVADIVMKTREDHKVDLKNAEITIIIEVIRSFAFISVVPNFFKYKKYNLLTLCEAEGAQTSNCEQISSKEGAEK